MTWLLSYIEEIKRDINKRLKTSPLSMPGQNDLVWQSNQSEKQQGINTHTCSHIGQNDLVWQSNQSEKQQGINTHTCSHIPDSRT
ncbi:hypothetical protein QL285_056980 [Trifolium repens]|nr:hypothetical protein QL285_056980 [Trifolium repens]